MVNPINPIIKFGKDLIQLSNRVDRNASNIENNTTDIKDLKKYISSLITYIKKLENELEKEKLKFQHQEEKHKLELEKYHLENEKFKSDLQGKLLAFENAMLKGNYKRLEQFDREEKNDGLPNSDEV